VAHISIEDYVTGAVRGLDDDTSLTEPLYWRGYAILPCAPLGRVIKPPDTDYEVELKQGTVFLENGKVKTPSSFIEPRTKETQYSVRVLPDGKTLVQVHKGRTRITGQKRRVNVEAGLSSVIARGLAPSRPEPISPLPEVDFPTIRVIAPLGIHGYRYHPSRVP